MKKILVLSLIVLLLFSGSALAGSVGHVGYDSSSGTEAGGGCSAGLAMMGGVLALAGFLFVRRNVSRDTKK